MFGKRRDDPFNDGSMTFGQHLEELRDRILKSLYWLIAGFAISLIPIRWVLPWTELPSMSGWAVSFIQRPLTRSLNTYYINQSSIKIQSQAKRLEQLGYSSDIAEIPARNKMTDQEIWLFPEDIARLRRILNGEEEASYQQAEKENSIVFNDAQKLAMVDNLNLYKQENPVSSPRDEGAIPFIVWKKLADDPRVQAKALSMPETFVIFIKAACFLGVIIGSPGIFYHFWMFVGAGLLPHEKKCVYKYFPFSVILFFAGAALAFFVVFEMVLTFLLTFNAGMNIAPDPRISEWMKFAIILPLGFGLSFQLPLVMFALYRLQIFTLETYWDKWKISVVVIAFLSMMFTPPDPWSMICMLSALVSLYFLGIGLCKISPLPKSQYDDDE